MYFYTELVNLFSYYKIKKVLKTTVVTSFLPLITKYLQQKKNFKEKKIVNVTINKL